MKTKLIIFAVISMLMVPLTVDAQVKTWVKKKATRAAKTAGKTADKEVDKEIDKKVTKGVLNLKDKLLGTETEAKGTDSTAINQEVSTNQKAVTNQEGSISGQTNTGGSVTGTAQGGADKSGKSSQGLGALSALMGGQGGDVDHKDSYNFDVSITMQMEIYDESSGEVSMVMDYVSYVNMETTDVAIDIKPQSEGGAYQADMTMIYDKENKSVFMLTNTGGQKMAIATPIDEMPDQGGQTGEYETDNPTYTKTGKTKTISGYKCEGYTMLDGENRVDMWVTDEIDFDPGRDEMKKAGIPMYYEGPFEGGMILEMEVYENDIKHMKMLVTDINEDASKSLSLSGYTIMNMNMGGEQK